MEDKPIHLLSSNLRIFKEYSPHSLIREKITASIFLSHIKIETNKTKEVLNMISTKKLFSSNSVFGKKKTTKYSKKEHVCGVKRLVVTAHVVGPVDVFVNKGWSPLTDHIYIHDICVYGKGSSGRIYDAEVLVEVLEEVRKEVTKDFPECKGVSISEYRFSRMPDFWIRHGFEGEGTFVPSSGIVYSWTW